MPLEIIGAGFGRTGTMSLYTALNQLGFPCYHMVEVIGNKANKSHLDFWRRVAHTPPGTQHDWNTVFANYTAAVDNPACCVWRELLAAYPRAKVILMTAYGTAEVRRQVERLAGEYLTKPFDLGVVVEVVRALIGPGLLVPTESELNPT